MSLPESRSLINSLRLSGTENFVYLLFYELVRRKKLARATLGARP